MGAVTRNVQGNVAPRPATKKQSAKSRPVDRVASAAPKPPVRRTHRRPPGETARREPQTQAPTPADAPLFMQMRRLWHFEMPRAERPAQLLQTQLDIYRGH